MPLILGTNSIKDTGFDVGNSCMFGNPNTPNSDTATDYLTRTFSAGNRRTFTISYWVKRGNLNPANSFQQVIGQQASDYFRVGFGSNEQGNIFRMYGRGNFEFRTKMFARDVAAWYHVCLAIDTTQGTAANRAKLYINGVQETEFYTENYPDQNTELDYNLASAHVIGRSGTSGNDAFNGYLAEFVSIDGSALGPTSFGEFDSSSGIWKPKKVSGLTFGTNGFYLDFADSGDLGDDESGNGNDFTETGIDASNQATDTCTNNFAVLNGNANRDDAKAIILTQGNLLQVCPASADWTSLTSTIGVNKGKWWVEYKYITLGGSALTGIINETALHRGTSADGYGIHTAPGFTNQYHGLGYQNAAYLYVGSGASPFRSSYGASYAAGDFINTALNLDDGEVTFYKNGSTQGTTSFTVGTEFWFFAGGPATENDSVGVNFGGCPPYSISSGNTDENGRGNFEHAPPSGFLALCTKNLATNGG